MNEELKKDYTDSLHFWDTVFTMSEEDKEKETAEIDADNDWKSLAPSEKLFQAAASLGIRHKVLDYGCGHGWASIIAAKSGCPDVTGVDVTASGIDMADFYLKLFHVDEHAHVRHVSTEWITQEPTKTYDGFICSNVLDVIPSEVAAFILEQAARIVTDDASIIIGLNYYDVPHEDESRHISVKFGNHIYVDGILRMVSRTDEEWCSIFEKYFVVEKLEHFAWPGEPKETRRLFYLKKK